MSKKLPWHSYLKAILMGESIDYFERYLIILRMLKTLERLCQRSLKILEIGAGPASPLKNYFSSYITTDVKKMPGVDIVADAKYLPFKDGSFDVVIAIDVLEHIPSDERELVLKEIIRVARLLVIIHTPLISGDNYFNSRFYDFLLLRFLTKKLKRLDQAIMFTLMHLKYGEPRYEDFWNMGFKLLKTDWNAKVWYNFMRAQLASHGVLSRLMWFIYLFLNISVSHLIGEAF